MLLTVLMVVSSERQEEQDLKAVITGPSSIRLDWRVIRSAQGYRLEWQAGKGQINM